MFPPPYKDKSGCGVQATVSTTVCTTLKTTPGMMAATTPVFVKMPRTDATSAPKSQYMRYFIVGNCIPSRWIVVCCLGSGQLV